jgi:hypothetical protein
LSFLNGDCKDENDGPTGSFLFQTISKWHPDEDRVVKIKQEKILSLEFSIFYAKTSLDLPFLNRLGWSAEVFTIKTVGPGKCDDVLRCLLAAM